MNKTVEWQSVRFKMELAISAYGLHATRCHRIDSAAYISHIFGRDNSHSSIVVSIQSRIPS